VSSVTNQCQVGYRNFHNRRIVVVDTPGFLDTYNDQKNTYLEIGRSLQMTMPGPHAFLIVQPFGRVTSEIEAMWSHISTIFGERVLEYSIIIFTHLDDLDESDDDSVSNFLHNAPPLLTRFMKKCGNRFCAFNNEGSAEQKRDMVYQLLEIVDKMMENNCNQVFTTPGFAQIDAAIKNSKDRGHYSCLSDESLTLSPETAKIVIDGFLKHGRNKRP
jgi:hypothetical protein